MNGCLETALQASEGWQWAKDLSMGFCPRQEKRHLFDSEVFSVACERLVKAAHTHSSDKGEFRHFALRCMRNGIVDYLRRFNRRRRLKMVAFGESQEVPAREEKGVETTEENIKAIMSPAIVESKRDEADREMMLDLYLRGKTVTQLMAKHKVSKQTVYNRIERIMEKIRRKLTC